MNGAQLPPQPGPMEAQYLLRVSLDNASCYCVFNVVEPDKDKCWRRLLGEFKKAYGPRATFNVRSFHYRRSCE